MKIVVFCPNAIGDLVMATPLFRALRHWRPEAHIAGIVRPNAAPTLDGNPWFDQLIRFDPRSKNPNVNTLTLVDEMRRGKFDLALLLPNSFRTALLAYLGGVKRRMGYARYGRSLLLTNRLEPPRDANGELKPSPIVPYYLEFARRLGCGSISARLELFTTEEDEQAADSALEDLGFTTRKRLITLNTGGAYGPAKSWPSEHFAVLASRLADELDVNVLVLCGPAEREAADHIASLANRSAVKSLGSRKLGVGLTKACVKRSSLLITTDSGPRHFAAPFGTPVLTIFGPTHIAWTRTQYAQSLHIYHPVPCGPCQQKECPLGHHHCMKNLKPDEVYAAALRLLGERGVRPPHFAGRLIESTPMPLPLEPC